MSEAGAALAAIAVACAVLSADRGSRVARRLALLAPRDPRATGRWGSIDPLQLRQAGLGLDPDRFLGLKLASALAGTCGGALLSLALPLGPTSLLLGGYAGYVIPSLVVERRAAAAREHAERACALLVERLEALVAAGRPAETALSSALRQPTGARLVDLALRRADDAYAMGAPPFRALAGLAREDGLPALVALAEDLEHARGMGTASLAALRERRAALRAAERAKRLEAASEVEAKLMLVLVLCYLPALVLLVVIPLFLGLLEGLLA